MSLPERRHLGRAVLNGQRALFKKHPFIIAKARIKTMQHIVIADAECPQKTAPIALEYGVGLEATTFYDTNYLEDHPNGIAEYLLDTKGIPFMTMHGPFTGLNTGVRDKLIRGVTLQRYLEACDTAEKLGIRDIIIHNNYYDYCAPRDVWRVNTRQLFDDLLQKIAGRNIRFHLENTLERDGELIAEVVRNAGSDQLRICLDVGHTQGMVHDGLSALEWIERYGELIGHVHLHNNYGQRDEHRNINDGTIPMKEVLAKLEEKAPDANWCIECGLPWQDVRQSLDYLIELGYLAPKAGENK